MKSSKHFLRRISRLEANRLDEGDAGFTLVEILIVIVIIPLLIGACAVALVTSINTDNGTSGSLSDTLGAQVTSLYYVRDVQGASEVTTDQTDLFQTASGVYSQTSPEVCGGPNSGSDALLVGFYHAATGGAAAEDVGYWLHVNSINSQGSDTEIDRYSCTLVTPNYTSSSPVKVVIASAPPGTATGSAPGGAVQASLITKVAYTGNGPYTVTFTSTFAAVVGQSVEVADVGGVTGLSGTWVVTSVGNGTFTVVIPSGVSGTYTSGGAVTNGLVDFNPDQFRGAASLGWASTRATALLSSPLPALAPGTIIQKIFVQPNPFGFTVGTKNGVDCDWTATTVVAWNVCTGNTLTIATPAGTAQVNCTGLSAPPNTSTGFTNCRVVSASPTSTSPPLYPGAGIGAVVSQADLAAVQISISAPNSGYRYSFLGSPRSGALANSTTSPGPTSQSPTMLLLGDTGVTLTGNGSYTCTYGGNNDKICVNGSAVIDGGAVTCQRNNGIYTPPGGITSAGGATTCGQTTIPGGTVLTDPVAPLLPSCFQVSPSLQSAYDTLPQSSLITDHSGNVEPGIYSAQLSGTLEPGVYVADGGVGAVTIAPPSKSDTYFSQNSSGGFESNSGVLIYLPAELGQYPAGCITLPSTTSTLPGITIPNNQSISVAPLNTDQSTYWFSGNPALADTWVWQDVLNPTPFSETGNAAGCSGLVYTYTPATDTATSNSAFSAACQHGSPSPVSSSTFYGLTYTPSAELDIGGDRQYIWGRLINAGITPQNGSAGVTLTGA